MKTAFYTALFAFLFTTIALAQTSLEGKVVDAASGEAILFGTVALYKNDVMLTGVETDLDGNYFFSDIDPGTYDVEASYIGYTPQRQVGVIVKAGRTNRLDFAINEGVLLDEVEVVEYKVPLIEIDHTTNGATITSDAIRNLPAKSIAEIAASPSGMKTTPGTVTMRSTRSDATEYYVDGVRVSGVTASSSTLPAAGQMTAGEWNDLHNWRDWLALLDEDNYSIMTERFAIRPTERFHVVVVNEDNAVLANIPVQLLDSDGSVLWQTFTDNSGSAELWENALTQDQSAASIKVKDRVLTDIVKIQDGSNTVVLPEECTSPEQMDIVFVVDATSSMNDEIRYLKSELLDVIDRIQETNEDIDFNLGSVFYRDVSDEYLTRVSPLTNRYEDVVQFVQQQNSRGGGDNPEAVDAALEEALKLSWREDALKLVFLVLDAPPHEDDATMSKIRAQIQEAASRGIKIIPVTASGIDRNTEFLMKFMAILTNGTYIFVTDHSGIGNPHLDPVVEDYEVEKLNDCLVRLIVQYSKSYSCDVPDNIDALDVNIFPNPSTQFITVKSSAIPDKIKVYSSNGMMVKVVTPNTKETRIELDDLVNGIYTVSIVSGEKVESRQIILLK